MSASRNSAISIAIIALLAPVAASFADEGAILRLDPVVQVSAIDGDKKRAILPLGGLVDRTATLTPGVHQLAVCYDASTYSSLGGAVAYNYAKCAADQRISFDASAGHIYRVKFDAPGDSWRAWVEDVTDAEANLPPGMNHTRPVHKGEGKSLLVLRIAPANGRVGLSNGTTDQIWFMSGAFGAMPMKGNGTDGFISRKVSGGDTVAITDAWIPRDKSIFDSKAAGACGETRIPVLEDAAGGKALYLGEFTFKDVPEGQEFAVKTEELEAARAFVATQDPKLAARFELARVRWMRVPVPCPPVPGGMLRNPGQTR